MIKLASLIEGRFRHRKNQVHLFDVPMFSVFADTSISKKDLYNIKRGEKRIKSAFENARQEIHALGFASMHSNVILKDLSGEKAFGLAHRGGKYMDIDISPLKSGNERYLTRTIVHEWAHLWMFNNSKEFKKAVETLYNKLVMTGAASLQTKDVETQTAFTNDEEKSIINSWSQGFEYAVSYIDFATLRGENYSNEELERLLNDIIMGVFVDICKKYQLDPSSDQKSKVKSAIKDYVLPKFIELANDTEKTKSLSEKDGGIYSYLWVLNELKPDDFSIMQIFRTARLPHTLKKTMDTMVTKPLIGTEHEFHRQYLKNLHNWVNSYGMSNDLELWATGIEQFFKLPLPHRKAIIKLMMRMGAN